MAARKKPAPGPDPREPIAKVICGVCEVQVPEDETDTFLDPNTGQPVVRCYDCRSLALRSPTAPKPAKKTRRKREDGKPAEPVPAEPVPADAKDDEDEDEDEDDEEAEAPAEAPAEPAPAPAKQGSKVTEEGLRKRAENFALERARAAQAEAELRAIEAVRELEAVKRAYSKLEAGVRAEQQHRAEAATALASRLADYELLLGTEPAMRDTRELAHVQPWMLEVAAEAARSAPDELDERTLTSLIVDAIVTAYAQRTLEATAIRQALEAAAMPLVEMERAARLVADTLAHGPVSPASERKDAIVQAWERLTVTTRAARAMVEEEVLRLVQEEKVEQYRATATAQVLASTRTLAVERVDPDLVDRRLGNLKRGP